MPVTFVIVAPSDKEGLRIRDMVYEVAEKDVIANKPGKIECDGWTMNGYIVASKKSDYWLRGKAAKYELTFLSLSQWWERAVEYYFPPLGEGESSDDMWLDYPYDFMFDYGSDVNTRLIDTDGFVAAGVTIAFEGPAESPTVVIGGNSYSLSGGIGASDKVEVDTIAHTIEKVNIVGERENAFHMKAGVYRPHSGSFIFEPVNPGSNEVSWDGSFGVAITVRELRSEPRWS